VVLPLLGFLSLDISPDDLVFDSAVNHTRYRTMIPLMGFSGNGAFASIY
jgi:hypothetical protein